MFFIILFLSFFSSFSQYLTLPLDIHKIVFKKLLIQAEQYKDELIQIAEQYKDELIQIKENPVATLFSIKINHLIKCLAIIRRFPLVSKDFQFLFYKESNLHYERLINAFQKHESGLLKGKNYTAILYSTFFCYMDFILPKSRNPSLCKLLYKVSKRGMKETIKNIIESSEKPFLLFFTDLLSMCFKHHIVHCLGRPDFYIDHARENYLFFNLLFEYMVHAPCIQESTVIVKFLSYIAKKSVGLSYNHYKTEHIPNQYEDHPIAPLDEYTFDFELKKSTDFISLETLIDICKTYGLAVQIAKAHLTSHVYYGPHVPEPIQCSFHVSLTILSLGSGNLFVNTLKNELCVSGIDKRDNKKEAHAKQLFAQDKQTFEDIIYYTWFIQSFRNKELGAFLDCERALIDSSLDTCYTTPLLNALHSSNKKLCTDLLHHCTSSSMRNLPKNDQINLLIILETVAHLSCENHVHRTITKLLKKALTESAQENNTLLFIISYLFKRTFLIASLKKKYSLENFLFSIKRKNIAERDFLRLQERYLQFGIPFWTYYNSKENKEYILFSINNTVTLLAPTDPFYLQKKTYNVPLKNFFYRCTVKIRLLCYYCLNNFMHYVSLLF